MSLDDRIRLDLSAAAEPEPEAVGTVLARIHTVGRRRLRIRRALSTLGVFAFAAGAAVAGSELGAGRNEGSGVIGPGPATPSPSASDPSNQPSPSPSDAPSVVPVAAGSPGPCPSERDRDLPPSTLCISRITADLDGDGRLDRFITYGTLDGKGRPRGWRARVSLASGGGSEVPIDFIDAGILPATIGAADADGDGDSEVFVVVDHGASTMLVGIYHLMAGRLAEVQVEGAGRRTAARFGLNGALTHGSGLQCRTAGGAAALVSLSFESSVDDNLYEWQETTYRWVGAALRLVDSKKGTRRGSESDPDFQRWLSRFYQLRCGALVTNGEIVLE